MRLVKKIFYSYRKDLHYQTTTLAALQEAVKAFLTRCFEGELLF